MWESKESPLDPEILFGTRRLSKDPKVIWEPGVPSDPEVVFRTRRLLGTRRFHLDPEVVLNPGLYKNLEVYLFQALRSFQDPKTEWGPEGTVLCLPKQDYYRYLFGFRILPLGSWPRSSSYVVFYFCRKSLTGLEGAGVGVMTQVPGLRYFPRLEKQDLDCSQYFTGPRCALGCTGVLSSFDNILRLALPVQTLSLNTVLLRLYLICSLPESKRVSSSGSTLHYMEYAPCLRHLALYVLRIPHGSRLLSKRMDVGVIAGASLNRNLEVGVLPEAWMIFPNQIAPYFLISSSNSGNNLCTQVNRSCSFSEGFPWIGHCSSNPSFPGSS
ncbi:hypothetical protein F2Q69_00023033 [Brassica cretica]|uniref:Uncharacterized protein n=1 Tax=Brassica cretica TaxID=69181 RepID=A0A8S9QDF3_BRACR|nr:hypothetical protein F2Q69_00023033 [Brassica cretica]